MRDPVAVASSTSTAPGERGSRVEIECFPDILVVGLEDWDEVERRHQLLLHEISRSHPECRILFVESPARLTLPRRLYDLAPRRVAETVTKARIVRPLPEWTPASRAANDAFEAAQLRRVLSSLGIETPLLWTKASRSIGLLGRIPLAGVVYDLTDDWAAAIESQPERRKRLRREMEELGRRANVVFACSRTLAESASHWNDCTHHLPNAVEPPGPHSPVPPELEDLPRPIFGYAGTLHESRLDIELVVAAARARPGTTFAFLGPDLLTRGARRRLFSLPNTRHLGVRPHRLVRAYLEGFDVCLIPHRVTEFTRSLDPLKVYEYLAAGRPIVSTPLPVAADLAEHLTYARSADELVALAERELAADAPERRRARQAAVAGQTWAARVRHVEQVLVECQLAG
jgi:teichuronic acid biosynthesis glycosyltransferase TuaH